MTQFQTGITGYISRSAESSLAEGKVETQLKTQSVESKGQRMSRWSTMAPTQQFIKLNNMDKIEFVHWAV